MTSGGHGRTELLIEGGIVAILRLERDSDLAPAIEAIRDGGVTAIEILFAGPTAIPPLGSVSTRLRRGISLGIGGVLTPEAAREAIRAGAAAVGVDDEMVPGDALARRDFSEIARRTGAFAEAVQRARGIAARPSQPVRPIEGPDVR